MDGPELNLFYLFVFFIYGLAFFGMGVAMTLESGRSPALAEARLLRPLAVFGLLHGTHEWLEFLVLQAAALGMRIPDGVAWGRLAILAASFVALLVYGIQAFRLPRGGVLVWMHLGLILLFLYAALIVGNAMLTYAWRQGVPWLRLSDALTRYLLAVPGAQLAALGLRSQALEAQRDRRRPLARNLNWAAIAFALYGFSQIFVPSLEMFPANLINAETFLALTGVPHQVVRSVMAVVVTLNLLRATQVVERERQEQVLSAQQAQLRALEEREALRRELLRHTVQAQEEERARIARELHDETAQLLSAFSLELATLGGMLKGRPQALGTVDHLQGLSRSMSQGLYRLVRDLRPAQLDDLGLVAALRYLFEQDCSPRGMKITFEVSGMPRRLDALVETVLFRVVQEGLNNVARHAGTDEAAVALEYAEAGVTLRVRDAGRGFDPTEVFLPPRGWGLAGMRERVESVGGQFRLQSAPGEGTLIEVVIPADKAILKDRGGNHGANHIDAG